jgi:hypothetical protein
MPLPQDLVQSDHTDHADTSQSTAHALSLQLWFSCRKGHTKPPLEADETIDRERLWVPPPQECVHALHAE